MTRLIDIGVNLTNGSFRHDRPEVIRRAEEAGVAPLVLTGTNLEASQAALALCREFPGKLVSTAGIHPHDAKSVNASTISALRELAGQPEVVSLGECGLDYDRDFSPRDVQRRVFDEQLDLAVELGMPVFLHERDAHDDFVSVLSARRSELQRAVVHCFTGTEAELNAYLELDLYVGITGWICDERRGLHLRDFVSKVPSNRLMIETDAPYLLPRTIRPKPKSRRNEPAYLPYVLEVVADAVGKSADQVAQETTATAREFFSLGEA